MGDFIKKCQKVKPRSDEPGAPFPLVREAAANPQFILACAIKFADVGHALKPFDQHHRWSQLVTEEFWKIGDREKSLGVPVSFLCDRNVDTDMAKSQIGYFKFICKPFYKAVEPLVDARLGPFDTLDANLWRWFLLSKGEQPPPDVRENKTRGKRARRASANVLRAYIPKPPAAPAAAGAAPPTLAALPPAPVASKPRRHSSVLSLNDGASSSTLDASLKAANRQPRRAAEV